MPSTSILITGATGRIGTNAAKHMDDLGHHVRALVLPEDLQETKLENLKIETVQGDSTSFDDVRIACRDINTIFDTG
jgi:nucleoside-diphosphate-sugar epimerase